MAVITVRLTEKEKNALKKYGKISDTIRDALHTYVNNKKSSESLKKLREYQKKNRLSAATEEIVAMVRDDRDAR